MNGGTGTDTLTGDNVANTWAVTSVNGGTVTGVAGGFSGVENLIGGSNTDTFAFTNAGSLTGTIAAAAGANSLTGDDDGNIFVVNLVNSGILTGEAEWLDEHPDPHRRDGHGYLRTHRRHADRKHQRWNRDRYLDG